MTHARLTRTIVTSAADIPAIQQAWAQMLGERPPTSTLTIGILVEPGLEA